MFINLSITPSPGIAVPAIKLRNLLQDCLARNLSGTSFESKIAALLIFPTFVSPRLGAIPNSVRFLRKEKTLRSTYSGSYDDFETGDDLRRLQLIVEAIEAAITQIPDDHLKHEDRRLLVEIVRASHRDAERSLK